MSFPHECSETTSVIVLWIGAVTKSKDGELNRRKTVGVVELCASKVFPKGACVLWHITLTRGRGDKDGQRVAQQIRLATKENQHMKYIGRHTHRETHQFEAIHLINNSVEV